MTNDEALALAAELEGFAEGSTSARASLMRDAAKTIRSLIPEPPTDDERETLASRLISHADGIDRIAHGPTEEGADMRTASELIRGRGPITDAEILAGASKYAEHVTGYSMRDGGYTYTCRCGWSETGPDAGSGAQKHRMRFALAAARALAALEAAEAAR